MSQDLPRVEPRVSVVMIFYDPEIEFFVDAIESVRRQTFASWELLLIDDGTSNGAELVAREVSARDPDRVRYLQHPGGGNRGTSPSRNLGIASASGEYVTMLDADDLWERDFLEHHVPILDRDPAIGMTFGPVERWFSWAAGIGAERDFVAHPYARYDVVLDSPELVRYMVQPSWHHTVPQGVVMRKSAAQGVGAYDEGRRIIWEDALLYSKISLANPVYVSSRCLYRYRQHPGSLVAQAVSDRQLDRYRLDYLTWLSAYVHGMGHGDGRLRRAIRREIWWMLHPRLRRVRLSLRARLARARRVWPGTAARASSARRMPGGTASHAS